MASPTAEQPPQLVAEGSQKVDDRRISTGTPGSTFSSMLGQPGSTNSKYIRKQQIGRGATGSAYIVNRVSDGQQFVAKEMELSEMSANARRYAYSEIQCLAKCDHFAIMGFEEDCEENGRLLLITEFGDAGDLRRHIKERAAKNNYFPEQDICQVFVQILLAVHHVHTRRMLHRDIKTANVFLSSSGLVKVGDFGFSNQYDETVSGAVAQSLVGTPYYLAPELWNGEKYGKKADMWSVGIILYELLALKRPYEAPSYRDMRTLVMTTPLPELPSNYSSELRAVCKKLLCTDPKARPSASEVLQMPFVEKYLHTFDSKVQVTEGLPVKLKAQISKNIAEYRLAADLEQSKRGSVEIQQAVLAAAAAGLNENGTPISLEEATQQSSQNTVYLQPFDTPVKKLSSQTGDWKDRHLFIDEYGTLIVAVSAKRDSRKGSEAAVRKDDMVNTIAYKADANATTVEPGFATGVLPPFVFVVELRAQKLYFAAPTELDQQTWIHRLQNAIGLV